MRILTFIGVLFLCFGNLVQADDQTADLEPIVVEASRSNDTIGNMNKDVSIITSEDINNSPAKSLPELLSTVPGVYGTINSNIHDQRIDIGGFGVTGFSNVLVLVDGRRVNIPDLSGPDLSLIDLSSVDHIEVIQGASTVLYGDNAGGGVINIVTKKGRENTKPSIILTSEVGSYKGNKEGLNVSGGIPKLGYQFDYDRSQSNGFRSNSNYWSDDYNTRLNYDPTDIFGVDFSQGYHLDRYRLPGGMSISKIDANGPTGVDPSQTGYGTTSDSHFDVTPHLKLEAGSSNIDLSLFTSARKRDNNFVFPGSGYATNYEVESYEFQPKIILSTHLTDRLDNKSTAGYDYIYYRENRRINTPGSLEDIVNATEASQGVYLLDELTLDEHWLFNAGIRGSWASYVFNQTQQTPIKFNRSSTTEGYDGGLGYKYNPDSKVFANYTRSYRLPNLDEFFQDPYPGGPGSDSASSITSGLTYQVGNQYQLGIKDNSFKDIHLGFTATAAQYKNEIYFDPGTNFNSNYTGRTRHYSEEADASVDLFHKKIKPFASVTFQQSKFVKGPYSGNQIPFVPDQIANAGVAWQPIDRLSTSITTNFVGKRFKDSDETNTAPKLKRYETVDWTAKYGFKNMEFWVTLQNIFNTRYITYAVYNSYYPAPGRNIEAGVKVKF